MTASGQLLRDTNSVLIKRADAVRVLAAADSFKVFKKLVHRQALVIDSLSEQVRLNHEIIDDYSAQDHLQMGMIRSLQDELTLWREKQDVCSRQIAFVQKDNRKLKRRAWWATVLGLAATGAMGFLYITK